LRDVISVAADLKFAASAVEAATLSVDATSVTAKEAEISLVTCAEANCESPFLRRLAPSGFPCREPDGIPDERGRSRRAHSCEPNQDSRL